MKQFFLLNFFNLDLAAKMEARKEQKRLQMQRRMAKPNAPLIQQAKALWEQLRSKTLDKKSRSDAMDQMMDLIKGKVNDLIFKHDASRIIQSCLKHGNATQRDLVAQELSGCWMQLATSQYGRFIISKVLTYCSAKYRHLIIEEIAGKVIKLIRHKEAGSVVEELYSGFANSAEKNMLVLDFYGKEFSLFKVLFLV
jgi:pumilio family protein 6